MSDDTHPNIKITALKSPFVGPENESSEAITSLSNDITITVGDVRTSVEESRFPRWWIVSEQRFSIEFTMVPTSDKIHPFWILLEDDRRYRCLHALLPSFLVTSPSPPPLRPLHPITMCRDSSSQSHFFLLSLFPSSDVIPYGCLGSKHQLTN